MCYHPPGHREAARSAERGAEPAVRRLVTDGGTDDEEASDGDSASDADDERTGEGEEASGEGADETTGEVDEEGTAGADEEATAEGDDGSDGEGGDPPDRSNVEIREAGEAEPASPEWDRPALDDIPEFEVRADEPVVERGGTTGTGSERREAGTDAGSPDDADGTGAGGRGPGGADPEAGAGRGPGADHSSPDPAAGRPNEARSPGATRVATEGTDAYLVALELCARLPDDVRLPAEAADLVPAAVEAELEQDIQSFAASEFDTPRPHVDTLSFEEVDGEIWLRIRIGVPSEGFAAVDPEAIRSYALQELEGVF